MNKISKYGKIVGVASGIGMVLYGLILSVFGIATAIEWMLGGYCCILASAGILTE